MNYYEHHIRDYDAATSHLTWDEDMAYTRLIRWYYRKEQSIPSDLKEACRQVRATSKAQRDAVQSVLREFFVLNEDGWHNETCDDLIARFKDGEPEREVKKANEENRMKRHRDERARLFKILTDAGEHAPWNIKMEELRELVSRITATAPETKTETPATAPETLATATQPPTTNTQSPDIKPVIPPQDIKHPSAGGTAYGAMAAELIKHGLKVTSMHPTLQAWVDDGFTIDGCIRAIAIARQNKPEPAPIPANYLDRILRDPAQMNNQTSTKGNIHDQRAATIAELTGQNRQQQTSEHVIDGVAHRVD